MRTGHIVVCLMAISSGTALLFNVEKTGCVGEEV